MGARCRAVVVVVGIIVVVFASSSSCVVVAGEGGGERHASSSSSSSSSSSGTVFAETSAMTRSIAGFERWMRRGGAPASTSTTFVGDVGVGVIPGLGRGLYAKKNITKGALLLEVPLEKCLSTASARADGTFGEAFGELERGATTNAMLAMHLLRQAYGLRGDSAYWPWLKLLPREVDSTLGWTEKELDEIEGSNLGAFTSAVKAQWRAEYDALNVTHLRRTYPDVFGGKHASYYTFEKFIWAMFVVWSRAIDLSTGSEDAPTARVMVPFLDMANHSPAKKLVPAWDAQKNAIKVYAASNFTENLEIRFNYDAKPSQYFLLQYGFIPENNPAECVEVTLRVADNDPLRDIKETLLEKHGLNPKTRNFEWKPVGIDADLLAATRVISMNEDEANDPTSVMLAIAGASVSARNDAHTKAVLLKSIASFLEGYGTTLKEDNVYVKAKANSTNLPSKRKRFALLLRMREKIILLSSANALFKELPDEDSELVIDSCRYAFYNEYDACMARARGETFRKFE